MPSDLDRLAYGWRGHVGVLVPPANTTVEPEFAAGMPAGVAVYASRLPGRPEEDTSIGLRKRFDVYNATLRETADSFGGMRLDALVYGCTGASYVVGPDGETDLLADLKAGAPNVCTAARAVRQVLTACGAARIAIVSPYPEWLTDAAAGYWTASGLEVAQVVRVPDVRSIYAITPAGVIATAKTLAVDVDAVVLSGTGVPTLDVIPIIAERWQRPVVSSASASIWWYAKTLGIAPSDVTCAAVRSIDTWIDTCSRS